MMIPDSSVIKDNKQYPLLVFFHLMISRPSLLSPHSAISFPAVFPCPRLFSHFILFFKLKAIITCLPNSGLKSDFALSRRKKYANTAYLQGSFLLQSAKFLNRGGKETAWLLPDHTKTSKTQFTRRNSATTTMTSQTSISSSISHNTPPQLLLLHEKYIPNSLL